MVVDTGSVIAKRYRLLQKLGEGGMGNVFLADDSLLSRQVAIKTIRPSLQDDQEVHKRIDQECQLHARLGVHANIIALYDKIESENNIFLVMEYVPGETLTTLITRQKKTLDTLTLDQILSIISQILKSLAHIHKNNIIHRDIKPSNIILTKDDVGFIAKLMDFGIAYHEDRAEDITRLTSTTTGGPGTPSYMAPERIDPKTFGELGPATDLYSVGTILFELLGGSPPFQGTMTEILTGHLANTPDFASLPSYLPQALITVLQKSLQKHQQERYQSADSFRKDLERYKNQLSDATVIATDSMETEYTLLATSFTRKGTLSQTTLSHPKNTAVRHRKSGHKILLITLLVLVLGAGLTSGAIYFFNSRTPHPAPANDPPKPIPPSPPPVTDGVNFSQKEAVETPKKVEVSIEPEPQQEEKSHLPPAKEKTSAENTASSNTEMQHATTPVSDTPVSSTKMTKNLKENQKPTYLDTPSFSMKNEDEAWKEFMQAREAKLNKKGKGKTDAKPAKSNTTATQTAKKSNALPAKQVVRERPTFSRPAASSTKCTNLRKSFQLGDTSSIDQYRQECL